MLIPIKTVPKRFVANTLKVLNPLLKLKKRELEVVTVILNVYFEHASLPDEDLYALLFSKEMRVRMRTEIGMTDASFNNHLVQLKSRRMLTPTLRISPSLLDVFTKSKKDGKIEVVYIVEEVMESTDVV